jgi:hypothetical protein
MITEEGRGLLVDWDLSKSLVNEREVPSPPERTVRVIPSYVYSFQVYIYMIGHLAVHGGSAH